MILNRCTARKFDAIAVIRGEIWIFTGKYFWRIGKDTSGHDILEQPVEFKSFWFGLPRAVLEDDNLVIDAVYERSDHKIVFFIGRSYYVLAGNTQLDEGPLPISNLGLPSSLQKVDGAFRWGWNNKIYFFSGEFFFTVFKCLKIVLDILFLDITILQAHNPIFQVQCIGDLTKLCSM